jgi:acyl-[acyl-carrier-protein]-phospholipid O-acyltransferase/long-chain-fatty-acid--[acyl-carrier-protein] ligase
VNSFRLLSRRRFLPLFITQFLGAFNGNLFKNATIVLILYRLADDQDAGGKVLATLALGLFVLPFFLFSATAGQLADRFDKTRVIRASKLLEIGAALSPPSRLPSVRLPCCSPPCFCWALRQPCSGRLNMASFRNFWPTRICWVPTAW